MYRIEKRVLVLQVRRKMKIAVGACLFAEGNMDVDAGHLNWLLAVGYWLLAAGCWLLAIGCWLLAAGYWLLAAGFFNFHFYSI